MNIKKPNDGPGFVKPPQTIRYDDTHEISGDHASRKAFLTVIRSRVDLGVHAFIDGPMILGRNPDCHFPLHDHGVSWQHARITRQPNDEFCIEDLRSTNGTRVNGTQIMGIETLYEGSKIAVGQSVLRFSLADEMDIDFHSEVETLVSTDPLTGLPSKRRFDQAFEFALRSAQQHKADLGVLMMDMDGVKQINDTHGHLFGAHVIGETGRLIAKVLGSRGHACRFGGDEFSAFMPAHNLDSALQTAEQIRQVVETAGFEKEGIPLKPTISIGVASYPQAGKEFLELISIADEALYRAKGKGKNCVAT